MSAIPSEFTSREALQKWLLNFHATSKSLDAQAFSMLFTTNAEVQYANNPVTKGREAIQQGFDTAFKHLDLMTHDIVYFDFVSGPEPKLYQAADIRYVVKGDDLEKDVIRIPGLLSGWLDTEDGMLKLKRCEIYLDASQLFGRMAEKGFFG